MLKKYARTVDVNDECPVDTGMLVAAHRNELRVRTSELKRKVRKDKDYLRTMYDTPNFFCTRINLRTTALTGTDA